MKKNAKLPPAALTKIVVIAAGVALLYSILGFLLFPAILKRIAVRELTSFTGRPVAIRGINFNPYSMSLTVHGFRIAEPDGGTILSVGTLRTTFAPVPSFLHHLLVFKGILVLEPSVNIARNAGGSFNFSDLLRLDWPKDLRLRFDLLRLLDGRIHFQDAAVPGGFSTTISRLTVVVNDFSTLPGHDNSLSMTAVSESGESFSWKGRVYVHPLRSQGQVAVENVPVRAYSPYFMDRFVFTIADGTVAARFSYDVDFSPAHFTLRLVDGTLLLRSLTVDEQGGTSHLFDCAGLALNGAEVDLVRRKVSVASVVLTGGSAFVIRRADNTFNVQHLVKPAPQVTRDPVARFPTPPADASSAGWSVAVGEIRVKDFAAEVDHVFGRETVGWKELLLTEPMFQTNPPAASVAEISLRDGKVVFTDPSFQPPVRMTMSPLDISIGAFSSESPGLARVAVSARIDDLAPLQISGSSNPISDPGETSVRGLAQNVSLLPLGAYAAKYLGYELTAGAFSMEIACLIQDRKLSLVNTISIDGLTLGGRSGSREATKLPVRLAIALLTDSKGRITLHVPISLALDNPKVDFQKAVIEGLIRPLARTAASPFAAMGAQLGGGGDELAFQEFIPGSADLMPRETGKLDTILQGLRRWPEILLDIEGSVDPRNDTGDLHLLAAKRAEAVKEYLLRQGALEPDRIFLIESPAEDVPGKGSRALLSLTDTPRGSR